MNSHPLSMKPGPHYRINFMSNIFEVIFPLFGGTFHLIKGIWLRGMFTGVLVLGLVFITFRKFSTIRVLSRIFCLGGKSILKKFLSHAAARKNFFRPSRGVRGYTPPEKFENIGSLFEIAVNFFFSKTFGGKLRRFWGKLRRFGGKLPPAPPPVDRTLTMYVRACESFTA